ncbi:MAG: pilus assembly protein TadG-related protein [Propionibacteriaceae bacterium]|nr:pilus assembly protein TadG-related protein [Propionibacteriaceae bacterium]
MWTAMVMPAFILCVGLGVDFAGHTTAEQEARAVAQEAARAGGQYLIVSGGRAQPDIRRAERAASAYVAASALAGSAVARPDGFITVEVSGEYATLFLGMIGVTTLPVHASGTARVVSVIDGNEE